MHNYSPNFAEPSVTGEWFCSIGTFVGIFGSVDDDDGWIFDDFCVVGDGFGCFRRDLSPVLGGIRQSRVQQEQHRNENLK